MLSAFPEMMPQWHGTDTVLTGNLDLPALYGVLAEIEALGLDLPEVRELTTPLQFTTTRRPPFTLTANNIGSRMARTRTRS